MGVFFAFLMGTIIGSFLNVLIYRLPRGENIAFPGSHCRNCGHQIKAWENIPVISYLLLQGRCSSCKEKISPIYPSIELLTGLLYAFTAYKYSFSGQGYIAVAFISILLVIFFIDLEHYIIPDSLIAALFILSLIKLFFLREPAYMNALITGLVIFGFFYLIFVFSKEKFGGGDVKLFTVLGFFFGWPLTNLLVVLASLLGLLVAGLMIVGSRMKKDSPIPFGPFIATASVITLFYGKEIWQLYEKAMELLLL